MKHEVEVFFDYACPFCFRAHQYLKELKSDYPDITIVWRPCEAHPRPDRYGPHSDLCIQGYYFALNHGVDIMTYHDRMYQATMVDRIDIENMDVLSDYVKDLVEVEKFRQALQDATYQKALLDGNDLAYVHNGVWAVPAYRMEGKKLDAIENVGVTKQKLQEFLDQVK